MARPHVSAYANHFSEENCHAQGFETPHRPALAGGPNDDGRGRAVVRPVGGRFARARWAYASPGRRCRRTSYCSHSSVAEEVARPTTKKTSEDPTIIFAGSCHDDQERPIADAEVFIYQVDMESFYQKQIQSLRTDHNGKFRFEPVANVTEQQDRRKLLLPQLAPYLIAAKAKGRATAHQRVPQMSVDPGHIELRMPEGAILSGKVTGPDGKPLEGALVSVSMLIPEPITGICCAVTDKSGFFEIRDLWKMDLMERTKAAGSYRSATPLRIHCSGFADKTVMCDKVPGTVNVKLQLAAIVQGCVIYSDDGKLAANVLVQYQGIKEHAWGWVVTDADGKYKFDSLGPDTYNIWVKKEGFTVHALDSYEAIPGVTKTAPDLRLVHGGFVVGHVVDADTGHPFILRMPKLLPGSSPMWQCMDRRVRAVVQRVNTSQSKKTAPSAFAARPAVITCICGYTILPRHWTRLRWMSMWPRGKQSKFSSR